MKQSASALQIKEKLERQKRMKIVAENETMQIIHQILKENPQYSDEQVLQETKKRPMSINAFLNEYLQHVAVSMETAKKYFDVFSNCLHPRFVKVKLKPEARVLFGFILNDDLLTQRIKIVRDVREKMGSM